MLLSFYLAFYACCSFYNFVSIGDLNINECYELELAIGMYSYPGYPKLSKIFELSFFVVPLLLGAVFGFFGAFSRYYWFLKLQIILTSLAALEVSGVLLFALTILMRDNRVKINSLESWTFAPDDLKFRIQQVYNCCGYGSNDTIVLNGTYIHEIGNYCQNRLDKNERFISCNIALMEFSEDLGILRRLLFYTFLVSFIYYQTLLLNSYLIWHFKKHAPIIKKISEV
jgi:hypothetical protein